MPYSLGVDNSSLTFCRKDRQLDPGETRSTTQIACQIIYSLPTDTGHMRAYSEPIMTMAMVIIAMITILVMAMMMVLVMVIMESEALRQVG